MAHPCLQRGAAGTAVIPDDGRAAQEPEPAGEVDCPREKPAAGALPSKGAGLQFCGGADRGPDCWALPEESPRAGGLPRQAASALNRAAAREPQAWTAGLVPVRLKNHPPAGKAHGLLDRDAARWNAASASPARRQARWADAASGLAVALDWLPAGKKGKRREQPAVT